MTDATSHQTSRRRSDVADAVFLPLDDYLGTIRIRMAVLLCQLPLTVMMTLILFLALLFKPATPWDPGVFLIPFLHVLIPAACLVLPWHRLPAGSFVLIPVADCLSVGLLREIGGPVLSVVGLLMAFPVIWLSVCVNRVRLALAVMAPIVATLASPLALGHEIEPSEMIRMIVFPTIMAALAFTGHAVARGLTKHREILNQNDRDLELLNKATADHAQLLDTVLETVNVGVWAMDTNGTDILTNRRFRSDRSWSRENVGGKNPFTICPGQVPEDSPSPAELAADGATFTHRLIRVGPNKDHQRTFSAAARPLLGESGHLKGSVLAFTDVTALVKAQTARDKFVATVSHELRTPLTSILGYLEILDEHPDPQYLGIIERNAERLLALINNLLLVACEELEIRRRPTNIGALLQESVRAAKSEATARGVTLTLSIQGAAEAGVDPRHFAKAVDELLSNAIKFSPEGRNVSVVLRDTDDRIELTVSDQGFGMTQQEQDAAFTTFFKADHAMETAIPGAGLGLPLCKAIIEAHAGTIKLESQPKSGTTVTIAMPR
ncbi:PAS domain-containing sensor histidine kinase [Paenarthrobacter sp. GOM3]|uniref:PAS domain-containing sensor histidine kinase n=1 Tax=Paenarthrobacter sp. GOM3 TaxID=2782567 RepID=UPI001BADD696|nr:PAS domain-containing sensor histidine kinase [Paenarthrobacter sp. GOM3]WOH20629.1 PAS domain-containing sensor histidine kinase [Paenarthrobacter sp. GOM3]